MSEKPGQRWQAWLGRGRVEETAAVAKVVERIANGPQGPSVVAAFDFDGAIVGGFGSAVLMHERSKGTEIPMAELVDTAGVAFQAVAKLVEANDAIARLLAKMAGKTDAEMAQLGSQLHEHHVQDSVFPEMRKIIAAHRDAGHTLVVATGISRYQAAPTVKGLGIDHLLCTEVEVAEGRLTGKLVGDSMVGPAKLAAIDRFVTEHGGTLAQAHYYADGDAEIELMTAVGHPHPVNPAPKLAEVARAQGWPVLRFKTRAGARPADFIRGIAGLAAIVPILQAGLTVGLLTRDKRKAANFIMPTWIAAQLKLAGVKLRVTGREHLAKARPAVFIFNHRNNFDASFVASLVRSNYVTIAKAEMAQNPIGKLIAAIAPTIFVDRAANDPQHTADTMQRIGEAIEQGYSVIIAPEGTRVRGQPDSVGRFKLGAFHIAQSAGVPVVPIVIRNALDVASRDGPMRPGTVDIAVLSPVDVTEAEPRKLAIKARQVQQSFIETLRDWPQAKTKRP